MNIFRIYVVITRIGIPKILFFVQRNVYINMYVASAIKSEWNANLPQRMFPEKCEACKWFFIKLKSCTLVGYMVIFHKSNDMDKYVHIYKDLRDHPRKRVLSLIIPLMDCFTAYDYNITMTISYPLTSCGEMFPSFTRDGKTIYI